MVLFPRTIARNGIKNAAQAFRRKPISVNAVDKWQIAFICIYCESLIVCFDFFFALAGEDAIVDGRKIEIICDCPLRRIDVSQIPFRLFPPETG